MRLRLLITNNGKHSDDKMATACAADLVENASNLTGQDALDMRRLENQIMEILTGHFKGIADREHAGLTSKGHEHLAEPLHAHAESAEKMEADILAAYEASPFAAGMDREQAAKNVKEVVHKWVRQAQHMHRDWFATSGMIGHHTDLTKHPDHDPENEHVKRWKEIHSPSSYDSYRVALHEHATGERL